MALPYRKWTDEEIKNRNVVDEGKYHFEIIKIIRKKTKPGYDKEGNPKEIYDMVEIDFNFYDINGVVKKLKDWIVFMEGMDWKFRHLARSTGLIELYDSEELDCHHLDKKKGIFEVGIKDYTDKDGITRKMNFVKDYLQNENIKKPANDFLDDDIPNM